MVFIMSSAICGQYDVIMHKLTNGNYQVKYNKHIVETPDKDKAVDEYVDCISHAMTCGEHLEGRGLGVFETVEGA